MCYIQDVGVDIPLVCNVCGYPISLTTKCKCVTTVFSKCPGRSQQPCPTCGNCKNIFAECKHCGGEAGTIVTGVIPINAITPLQELYEELGKSKWVGTGKSWNEAIDAVRVHIRKSL